MKYEMLPQLLLRAPLLSYAGYDTGRLAGLLGEPWFRNALQLASPAMAEVSSRPGCPPELSEKEWFTLSKYYNRMCFRATPFGAFAGISTLCWGTAGEVILSPRGQSVLHIQPAMRTLALPQPLRPHSPLTINGTLYPLGGGYRYLMRSAGPDGRHIFHLRELEGGKLDDAMFRYLGQGRASADGLANWLVRETGCSAKSAADYIGYLVGEQVLLVPSASPLVCREAKVPDLQQRLLDEPGWNDPVQREAAGMPQVKQVYACLERPLLRGTLDRALQQSLLDSVSLLQQLESRAEPERLSAFKRQFVARYEDRRIPLMQVFDPDTGWEYGALTFQGNGRAESVIPPAGPVLTPAARWIIEQVTSPSRRDMRDPVLLKAAFPVNAADSQRALPPTLAVLFRRHEQLISIDALSAASATQLIGRFSLFSDEAWAMAVDLAGREAAANPDVVFADMVHRSDDRVDNVNRRRRIYEAQIDLDGSYEMDAGDILRLDDLVISVQRGAFVLESLKLRKRVVPRLSTAYHYTRSQLPVFQFLADLQAQGLDRVQALRLDQLLPGQAFYPRVVLGQTVLCAARWVLKADEWPELFNGQLLNGPFQKCVTALRLPDLVAVEEADMYLVFDVSRPDEAALLLKHLAGRPQVTLVEYLKSDRTVKSDGEPLAAQFMAFLSHGGEVYPAGRPVNASLAAPVAFGPGSEWLYLKLYCSIYQANHLLQQLVPLLLKRYGRYIRQWFFIRYTDPEHHVRVRFRLSVPAKGGAMLVTVQQWLARQSVPALLQQILVDTYRPEHERYGLAVMPWVEAVFGAGSELAIRQIAPDDDGDRAMVTVTAVCHMIAAMLLDSEGACAAVTERMFQHFYDEFNRDKNLLGDCSSFYRNHRSALEARIGNLAGPEADAIPGMVAFKASLVALKRAIAGGDATQAERLAADLVHLQINRMLISDWRRQELSVWFLLNKLFRVPRR